MFSFLINIMLSGCVQFFDIFILAFINILVLFLLYSKINFRISNQTSGMLIFIFIYFLYSLIISFGKSDMIFLAYRFHDIISAFLLINYILVRKIDILKEINYVFRLIIIHAFIGFILSVFFFDLFSPISYLTDEKIGISRFLLFFAPNSSYLGIHRAQGLFWEPGVLQIYLNIFLFILLSVNQKKEWFFILLTSFLILATLSTTGFIIFSIIIVHFFSGIILRKPIFLILFLLTSPIFYSYYNFTKIILNDKFDGDRIGSYEARRFDALNSFNIILDNPFGIGFSHEKYQEMARNNIYNIQSLVKTDRASTNGIFILFVSTGIFFGFVFLTMLFFQNILQKNRFLFFLIIIFSLTSEPLFFSPFFLTFALSSLVSSKQSIFNFKYERVL